MKYIESILIDVPRERVMALLNEPDYLEKWQEGFQSATLVEGDSGRAGAKSRLVYAIGKRRMEMLETLEAFDPPEHMVSVYDGPGMWNRNVSFFADQGGATMWSMECEFRPQTLLLKLVTRLAPNLFRNQTAKNMKAFKKFAESL